MQPNTARRRGVLAALLERMTDEQLEQETLKRFGAALDRTTAAQLTALLNDTGKAA